MAGELRNFEFWKNLSDVVQHLHFWILLAIGAAAWFAKIWRSRRSPKTLLAFVQERFGNGALLDKKLLRQLTCVVVDDKPADFPIDFMRGFFHSVVVETKVSLNDAERLAEFDVIFLDVADVVIEDAQRGGALLIERIRQYRQDGIIVSVSSKKYDVEVTRYFEAADIRIRKPVSADTIEEQFVAHLGAKVGPEALARAIDKAVLDVAGPRKLAGLVRWACATIEGNREIRVPRQARQARVEDSVARLVSQSRRIA